MKLWDQIIQIHKMRIFTQDRLKAIADEKGYYEDNHYFIIVPMNIGNKYC